MLMWLITIAQKEQTKQTASNECLTVNHLVMAHSPGFIDNRYLERAHKHVANHPL